jgi:hypothetical protein
LARFNLLADGLELVRERLESGSRVDETVMPLLNEIRAVTRRLQLAGDGLRTRARSRSRRTDGAVGRASWIVIGPRAFLLCPLNLCARASR